MEPESPLPWSHEPATSLYPEPDESSHTFQPYFLKIHFNITLTSTTRSSEWSLPFNVRHYSVYECDKECEGSDIGWWPEDRIAAAAAARYKAQCRPSWAGISKAAVGSNVRFANLLGCATFRGKFTQFVLHHADTVVKISSPIRKVYSNLVQVTGSCVLFSH
jgi:hypothetical protein